MRIQDTGTVIRRQQRETKRLMAHQFLKPGDTLYIYYIKGHITMPQDLAGSHPHYHGNWIEGDCSFLFFSAPSDRAVATALNQNPDTVLADRFEMTLAQWRGEHPGAFEIGDICVHPPWEMPPAGKEGDIHIVLDPGVVFGTGRHPTTEDCIRMLQDLLAREPITSLLDIGTGTGLLSLAAAALGIEKIIACDLNPLAVKTTRRNIRLNAFKNRVLPVQARGETLINTPADAVVANIHYDVMKAMIAERGFWEKKWFILSGLLKTETEKITDRLDSKGVCALDITCADGVWHTILGKTTRGY